MQYNVYVSMCIRARVHEHEVVGYTCIRVCLKMRPQLYKKPTVHW